MKSLLLAVVLVTATSIAIIPTAQSEEAASRIVCSKLNVMGAEYEYCTMAIPGDDIPQTGATNRCYDDSEGRERCCSTRSDENTERCVQGPEQTPVDPNDDPYFDAEACSTGRGHC